MAFGKRKTINFTAQLAAKETALQATAETEKQQAEWHASQVSVARQNAELADKQAAAVAEATAILTAAGVA